MSNSIKKAPSACSLGDVIKFKLISEYDTTVYSGKIQCKGVRGHSRHASRHAERS
jgi:hypothetical protein